MKFLDNIKKNQSLMRFIETTQSHMVTAEIGNSSVVVAYYLLLSLFPLLIAVGNVLPYLRIDLILCCLILQRRFRKMFIRT